MEGVFLYPTPPQSPFTPYTFWLLLCPLTQTFPQKRGRKPFTPFYLPTSHPLPCCPLRGCTGAENGIPPHFFPLCLLPVFPPPNFTEPQHTHTHTQIRTYRHIQTEPTRSTAVHKVTNWGFCLLKGGWGNPYFVCTHTHIEPSDSIVGKFHSTPDNAHCPRCLRGEIWCCLCGR